MEHPLTHTITHPYLCHTHLFHTPSHLFTPLPSDQLSLPFRIHFLTLPHPKPSHSHPYPSHTITHSHPHSSDAHDYDLCIKLSDVLVVTTYYKSMLPAIEFTLTDKEVVYTHKCMCSNAMYCTCSNIQLVCIRVGIKAWTSVFTS